MLTFAQKQTFGCFYTAPDADFSASTTTPCVNQTITFSDQTNPGSATITNWSWNFGTNAIPPTATGQGPHSVYYTTSGSKSVSLTVSYNYFGNQTNTETKNNYITVTTGISSVNISPTSAQILCLSGSGTQLTVSETGGGTITARQWGKRSSSGGTITPISGATGTTYTPTGASLGSGTWYVVCTSTPTCGSATVSNEVTVTITSNLSSVNITPIVAQTFCIDGSGFQLSATETGGGTITAKQWGKRSSSGGTITPISGATGTTYTPTGTSLGSGTWYVVCTSTPTCGSATVSNEVTIAVEATPVAGTLAKLPDQASVCEDTSVSATLTAGSGGNGTDETEYRYDGGTWTTYTSGSSLTTTGHTSVEIQTRRAASVCSPSSYNTVSWTILALPIAVISSPAAASDCPQLETSQGFNAESGALGYTIILFTVDRPTGASSWSFDYSITGISSLYSGSPNGLNGTINSTSNTETIEIWVANAAQTEYTITFIVDKIRNNDTNCLNGTDVSRQFILLPMPAVGPFE